MNFNPVVISPRMLLILSTHELQAVENLAANNMLIELHFRTYLFPTYFPLVRVTEDHRRFSWVEHFHEALRIKFAERIEAEVCEGDFDARPVIYRATIEGVWGADDGFHRRNRARPGGDGVDALDLNTCPQCTCFNCVLGVRVVPEATAATRYIHVCYVCKQSFRCLPPTPEEPGDAAPANRPCRCLVTRIPDSCNNPAYPPESPFGHRLHFCSNKCYWDLHEQDMDWSPYEHRPMPSC
jgi:hypothetical protein